MDLENAETMNRSPRRQEECRRPVVENQKNDSIKAEEQVLSIDYSAKRKPKLKPFALEYLSPKKIDILKEELSTEVAATKDVIYNEEKMLKKSKLFKNNGNNNNKKRASQLNMPLLQKEKTSKKKKTTTRQRLGKLLKINRLINF